MMSNHEEYENDLKNRYNDVSYFKEPNPVNYARKWKELESDMVDVFTDSAIK